MIYVFSYQTVSCSHSRVFFGVLGCFWGVEVFFGELGVLGVFLGCCSATWGTDTTIAHR